MKLPKLTYQKNSNLKRLYVIRLMRELVNKLVMFFLPIYYFNLHLPFWDQINWSLARSGQPMLTVLQIGIFNIAILHLVCRLVSFISSIWVLATTSERSDSASLVYLSNWRVVVEEIKKESHSS